MASRDQGNAGMFLTGFLDAFNNARSRKLEKQKYEQDIADKLAERELKRQQMEIDKIEAAEKKKRQADKDLQDAMKGAYEMSRPTTQLDPVTMQPKVTPGASPDLVRQVYPNLPPNFLPALPGQVKPVIGPALPKPTQPPEDPAVKSQRDLAEKYINDMRGTDFSADGLPPEARAEIEKNAPIVGLKPQFQVKPRPQFLGVNLPFTKEKVTGVTFEPTQPVAPAPVTPAVTPPAAVQNQPPAPDGREPYFETEAEAAQAEAAGHIKKGQIIRIGKSRGIWE